MFFYIKIKLIFYNKCQELDQGIVKWQIMIKCRSFLNNIRWNLTNSKLYSRIQVLNFNPKTTAKVSLMPRKILTLRETCPISSWLRSNCKISGNLKTQKHIYWKSWKTMTKMKLEHAHFRISKPKLSRLESIWAKGSILIFCSSFLPKKFKKIHTIP